MVCRPFGGAGPTAEPLHCQESYANDPCPDDRDRDRRGASDSCHRASRAAIRGFLVLGRQGWRHHIADSGGAYRQSPIAGVDWLITRTHGGLYVSGVAGVLHAARASCSATPTRGSTAASRDRSEEHAEARRGARWASRATISGFIRTSASASRSSEIVDAQAEGPFATTDQSDFADEVISNERASFSPLFIAGGQYRLTRCSVFGQATLSPAQQNFILYNGRPFNFGYEFGLRYNFGTSIDRRVAGARDDRRGARRRDSLTERAAA